MPIKNTAYYIAQPAHTFLLKIGSRMKEEIGRKRCDDTTTKKSAFNNNERSAMAAAFGTHPVHCLLHCNQVLLLLRGAAYKLNANYPTDVAAKIAVSCYKKYGQSCQKAFWTLFLQILKFTWLIEQWCYCEMSP